MRISATGMQAAQSQLAVHAHNIANVSTEALSPGPDLVEDIVGLITAKTMYAANATAFAVLADTERHLLDVRA
ncbi:MAG TPA: flagellar basal body protein [Solirubrobacteraceae bacterium]|nr:flagellar basal body protein [Solirubrobacteraceae bacterium]